MLNTLYYNYNDQMERAVVSESSDTGQSILKVCPSL